MVNIKSVISEVKSSKEYIEYVKYHENNIFSITRVARWELLHSNFIAWLLNPKESHGLGMYPIIQFLLMLCNMGVKNYPSSHTSDIFSENNNIKKVEIFREFPVPVTQKNGKNTNKHIDLLIKITYDDGVLPIVIENKVGSSENGKDKDQTVVYYDWAENNLKYEFGCIYLCLAPHFNNIDPKCQEFNTLDYQDLVNKVIEPSLWRTNNAWTHDTIKTYLQCLSYQKDYEKGQNTMAISTEERQILNDFLKNNENFINSLFDIWSEDATEEEKNKINKVRAIAKDYRLFEFNGKEYNKAHLATAVVKKIIEDENPQSFGDLSNRLKIIIGNKTILKKADDITPQYKKTLTLIRLLN